MSTVTSAVPTASQRKPAGHGRHSPPAASAYVPGAQGTGCTAPGEQPSPRAQTPPALVQSYAEPEASTGVGVHEPYVQKWPAAQRPSGCTSPSVAQ